MVHIFHEEKIRFGLGVAGIVFVPMILFYKSMFSTFVFSLFILFAFYVPGYVLGFCLIKNDRFLSTMLGISSMIAFFGIESYFLGLLGIHVRYHAIFILATVYGLISITVLGYIFTVNNTMIDEKKVVDEGEKKN